MDDVLDANFLDPLLVAWQLLRAEMFWSIFAVKKTHKCSSRTEEDNQSRYVHLSFICSLNRSKRSKLHKQQDLSQEQSWFECSPGLS